MLLRRTQPDDLDGVVMVEEGEDTAHWFVSTGPEWHQDALADPDQLHLVFSKQHHAEDARNDTEELVGFAVLSGFSQPGPIKLRRMVISSMQRGKGYGRQLLGELLKLVAEEMSDRDLVWLRVKSDNQAAQQLYQSVGFELGEPPEGVEPMPGLSYLDCEL